MCVCANSLAIPSKSNSYRHSHFHCCCAIFTSIHLHALSVLLLHWLHFFLLSLLFGLLCLLVYRRSDKTKNHMAGVCVCVCVECTLFLSMGIARIYNFINNNILKTKHRHTHTLITITVDFQICVYLFIHSFSLISFILYIYTHYGYHMCTSVW